MIIFKREDDVEEGWTPDIDFQEKKLPICHKGLRIVNIKVKSKETPTTIKSTTTEKPVLEESQQYNTAFYDKVTILLQVLMMFVARTKYTTDLESLREEMSYSK